MNSTNEEKKETLEFAEYLLRIGNGNEKNIEDSDESDDYISIPDDLIVKKTEKEFVELIYPNIANW